jgi:hypothetical protein
LNERGSEKGNENCRRKEKGGRKKNAKGKKGKRRGGRGNAGNASAWPSAMLRPDHRMILEAVTLPAT